VAFPKLWDQLELAQLLSRPIKIFDNQMKLPELLGATRKLVSQTNHTISICCFIDGLDEFEGRDEQIIETIIELDKLCNTNQLRNGGSFKLLFSSRDYTAFEAAFSRKPNFRLNQYTRPDIASYVEIKLKPLHERLENLHMDKHKAELDKIAKYLIKTASGVFLWVRLAIQSLVDGIHSVESIEELWLRVQSVPEDLTIFYQQMWDKVLKLPKIRYAEVRRLFLIALDAPNVFTDMRFVFYAEHLWKLENAKTAAYQDERINLDEFTAKVKATCGGFLEIPADGIQEETNHDIQVSKFNQTSRLHFVHQSMKEFVRENLKDLGEYKESEIDVYLMNTHLLLLHDIARTSGNNVEAWKLQSPYQFFLIRRVEKRTQKDQLPAIEAFEALTRDVQENTGMKHCQDFMTEASIHHCHTWVRSISKRKSHNPLQLLQNGIGTLPMTLFHHIFLAGQLASLNQDWTEYNGWPLSNDMGAPDHEMIRILLRAAEGRRLDINADLSSQLENWKRMGHHDDWEKITKAKYSPQAMK
jgi:hypothetical protein